MIAWFCFLIGGLLALALGIVLWLTRNCPADERERDEEGLFV